MSDAVWVPGDTTVLVDAAGTLLGSFQVKDGTTLAATVTFTLTAKRGLVVRVNTEPDAPGLTDFQAWSS